MIISIVGKCFLICLIMMCCAGTEEQAAVNVDICDLTHNPKEYAGKMVSVSGQVYSGWTKPGKAIKEFTIKQLFSSDRCVTQLRVVLPESVIPKTSFEVRDGAFEKLEEALRTSKRTDATFHGRFEAAAPAKKSRKTQRVVLRLVLERVSDVTSVVLPNR